MADPQVVLDSPALVELHNHAITVFRERGAAYERDSVMPTENLQDLHERGLLHAAVSKQNGGLGSNLLSDDPATFLQLVRTICHGDSSTAHCFQVHNHTAWILEGVGTPEQIDRFLKPVTARFGLFSSVGSEPGRTNMYEMKTKAKRVKGGLVVNGVKNYVTNGPITDAVVAFVALDGVEGYTNNHQMIILEPGMDGQVWDDPWYQPNGMRAARSSLLTLNDVFVPDSHLLGAPGAYPNGRWQGRFHLGFAANYLGTAEGLYAWTVDYLRKKGKARDGITQLRIGEMKIALDAARAQFHHAIRSWAERPVVEAELLSMSAKSTAAHAAFDLSHKAIHASGSTALFDEFPLSRFIRDLETHVLHAGHDRTAQIIGQAEFGETFDSTLQR
jgi:alkylation response protein AidB-like acyl-CoA dehydrogenase